MKYVKMLGLLAVAAAALMAIVGTASASTLTSPAGTTYTSTIKATSTNSALDGAFITVSCGHSTAEGKVEQHGAEEAGGKITGLTFTECNYPVTIKSKGKLTIHSSGTVTAQGFEILIHTSVGECVFSSTEKIDIGTLKGGTPAVMNINSANIPRTGGSFFCGSSGVWTGSYTVTTPGTLFVD